MTSIGRRIARNHAIKNGVPFKRKPQVTILLPDGGYRTLHPTQGWMKVSGKRLKGK